MPSTPPPTVGFTTSSILVSQQSDSVSVTLSRQFFTDNNAGTLQVRLATAPSPAIGVNLPAVDQTVTFAAGEDSKTVTILIIKGAPNSGEVDVALTLARVDGPPNVVYGGPTVLQIKASADATPPTITGSRLTRRGIELMFSEPMDPARVQN
jgi:hypothetical protein